MEEILVLLCIANKGPIILDHNKRGWSLIDGKSPPAWSTTRDGMLYRACIEAHRMINTLDAVKE